MVQLEIGKTYLRNTGESVEKILGSFDLVKILGAVEESTREYRVGYRFFGDDAQMYTEQGGKLYSSVPRDRHSWNGELNWNDRIRRSGKGFHLIREAVSTDFSDRFTQKLWISPEQRNDVSKYIPATDPRFTMVMGNVYLDRMGFPHLVDELWFSPNRDDARFGSQKRGVFGATGMNMIASMSMRDLVFQRL